MPLALRPIPNSVNLADPTQLAALLRSIFNDLEDQLAQTAQVYVTAGIPAGLNKNDVVLQFDGKNISVGIASSAKSLVLLTAAMIDGIPTKGLIFNGLIAGTGAIPTVPVNTWGFYDQTGIGIFLYFNDPTFGTKRVQLS